MERKISDIKDKKLKAENITLAAIYNILFTNDIVLLLNCRNVKCITQIRALSFPCKAARK